MAESGKEDRAPEYFVLRDLVEEEAAARGLAPRVVWKLVFEAFLAGTLEAKYFGRQKDFLAAWQGKGGWPSLPAQTLQAIERGTTPETFCWIQEIGVRRDKFRRLLPSHSRRARRLTPTCRK